MRVRVITIILLWRKIMKITIEKYNKNWPIIFEEEKLRLKNILGSHAINIYHVGSTSVPELAAKPKIDIIVTTDKCL